MTKPILFRGFRENHIKQRENLICCDKTVLSFVSCGCVIAIMWQFSGQALEVGGRTEAGEGMKGNTTSKSDACYVQYPSPSSSVGPHCSDDGGVGETDI